MYIENIIHPDFRLIEEGRLFTVDQIFSRKIDIPIPHGLVRPGLTVKNVLQSLIQAAESDVPILLDKGSGLDPPIPEHSFLIGILTSGTTGVPKCTWHRLGGLMERVGKPNPGARWLLTYSPHSYAGVQVILNAAATGAVLISCAGLDVIALIKLAVSLHPRAVSATPSFWRLLLMSVPATEDWLIEHIVLGGEAVDDILLERIKKRWPSASVRHIYASTEAGSVFSVNDGKAGFPTAWLNSGTSKVTLRITDGMLYVRSPFASLTHNDWYATGDLVEVKGDRVHFRGRADGMLNIGGEKIDLEKLELQLLRLPEISDARLYGRSNAITGYIVEAEIVCSNYSTAQLHISDFCKTLRPVERPRRIIYVDRISLSSTGKKVRRQ